MSTATLLRAVSRKPVSFRQASATCSSSRTALLTTSSSSFQPIQQRFFSPHSHCGLSRAFPLQSVSHFSTTSPKYQGSSIFPDPSRPDLFFHFISSPNPISSSQSAYALSFLSTPLPAPDSTTIIGWVLAGSKGETQTPSLRGFRENPAFRDILHETIRRGLEEGVDDIQINGAIQTGFGWMHVHDDRNIPALGRIGDPDDILASVLVEDGKIKAETYQAMPAYRLCTADGLTRLTPGLDSKLRQVLTRHASEEMKRTS